MVAFGSTALPTESLLRIATFVYEGLRQVGLVSEGGLSVAPFRLDGQRGALPIIELIASGSPLPAL